MTEHTWRDPSTSSLWEGVEKLVPECWLRDAILDALAQADGADSVTGYYQKYFNRVTLEFQNPDDATFLDFLSSRMLESEEVVNAHVEEQRDHLRHTIHDFLFGYLLLNTTEYFRPIAEEYASRIGYEGREPLSCLNHAWFLAAHFHDLGYPVEFHRYLLDFSRSVMADFPYTGGIDSASVITYRADAPLPSLFAWRSSLYGRQASSVQLLPPAAVRAQLERRDHALTAGFLFWERAEEQARARNSQCFSAPVLRTAALACASHNFQFYAEEPGNEWYKISLRRDPASFLLQLVDELQDWSRERVDVETLWALGVPKQIYSRVVLTNRPLISLSDGGGLDVAYEVAVQPFLDDPDDKDQLDRARMVLERSLVDRSRRLGKVLDGGTPGISVDAQYQIGPEKWPGRFQPCETALTVGEKQPTWRCRFQPPPPDPPRPLSQADASESDGAGRLVLESDGTVAATGLQLGTVYLLVGEGGVGKSTLLRRAASRHPVGFTASYLEVIPPDARELDLEPPAGDTPHLFLLDHFDHVLSRREAEHWKREIAQVSLHRRAVLVVACRAEVAERWPYRDARKDIRTLTAHRQGLGAAQPEEFIQEKLRELRPALRDQLAQLAWRVRSERWVPAERVDPGLIARAPDLLRPVGRSIRFAHDHIQDALAALGLLQLMSRPDPGFDMGRELAERPPWVYVFLVLSLCGPTRGVSPFLDLGREGFRHRRHDVLERFLALSRELLWLQHTGATDLGALGGPLPIEQLSQALKREAETIRPEHFAQVRAIEARSLDVNQFSVPDNEQDARRLVQIALRFADLAEGGQLASRRDFPAARWWAWRAHNMLCGRAYVWAAAWPDARRELDSWASWRERYERERHWIDSAPVPQAVKEHWLGIWMSHMASLELQDLERDLQSTGAVGPVERSKAIQRLEEAMRLLSHASVYSGRALATVEQPTRLPDGFQTLAQALGDKARVHFHAYGVWRVVNRLKEDPANALQFVLRFERQMRRDWDRARRVLLPGEMLSRFYACHARLVACAAALRKCRTEPRCPLHGIQQEARTAFEKWLKDYSFQVTRDPRDDIEKMKDETHEVIRDMEDVLRSNALRWIGKEECSYA